MFNKLSRGRPKKKKIHSKVEANPYSGLREVENVFNEDC